MNRLYRASQYLEKAFWGLQQVRGPKSSTTKLPVELLKDVESLGVVGKIVMVNHGFARNFLVPQRLAAVRRGKQSGSVSQVHDRVSTAPTAPTTEALGHNDQSEERMQSAIDQQRKRLEAAVKKLTTIPLVLRRKATEDGRLDKSVTADDIAEAIGKQMQIEIVPDLLDIGGEPLQAIGEYRLPLKLVLPGGERGMVDVNILAT